MRATVHRIAGAILIGVSLLHVITLIVSRGLRRHWLEMWPRVGDAREGALHLAYLLGLRDEKPRLSSHGYVEKAEYWAVVWGTAVMALTGAHAVGRQVHAGLAPQELAGHRHRGSLL